MRRARFHCLACILIAVAACTPRPALKMIPPTEQPAKISSVFVSTTRNLSPELAAAEPRSAAPSYLRYDLSIPPNRDAGGLAETSQARDPRLDFLVTEAVRYPGADPFRSDLRRALLQLPPSRREALIYVHGFNNNFDQGVLRIAQLADDFGLDGVALHYSWPSAASPFGYQFDKESVLFARDGLEDLINQARAAGANRVLLIGHSMGAQLIMEALRQIEIARPGDASRKVDAVVLVSPDIDVDVFRSQLARVESLPDPFIIFISRRDRALQLSAWLTGQQDRLGNLEDLYDVKDLRVTILDVTSFSSGIGHFTPGDSPALISILSDLRSVDAAFQNDTAGRTGLFPGVVMTVQNATEIILSPISTIAQ